MVFSSVALFWINFDSRYLAVPAGKASLWTYCDTIRPTLPISGFVDGVIFHILGPRGQHNSSSPTKFFSVI